MTCRTFSPKGNPITRLVRAWVTLGLLALAGSILAQDTGEEPQAAASDAFTITAIAFDDGWQTFLRNPTSIFVDRNVGELLVADGGNHRVVIYNERLQPKFSFDHFVKERRTGRMMKGEPRDLVVNRHGDIILADNLTDHLDVLDFRGRLLEQIHLDKAYGDTSLTIKAQSVAIDEAGNLYVATTGDVVTVMVFDIYFELVRTIGRRGGGPSEFNTPLAIHVDGEMLYVTDLYAEPAVKVFDTSGVFRFGFGGHEIERADMSFPSGLAVLPGEGGEVNIWITDGLRQVIKVFDASGEFVELVGGYGLAPGEFRYPSDIAALNDSVFFVVERIGGRIQRFETK